METKLNSLLIGLALLAGVHSALAQNPVITSFSQNGLVTCSNLQTGSTASVEWASSVSGPWKTNWAGLDAVIATNGTIAVSVPLFYRVRGVVPATNLIPAGVFTMGNTITNDTDIIDASPTNVFVSGFTMDTNLVSYTQWQSVYSYATNHGYGFANAGSGKGANHPVQTVDWYDCVKWSNARSAQAGLTPVYYTDAGLTQVYTNGEPATLYPNWAVSGYRLPTEAEWEKAARAGLSGQRFPWGLTISENQANYTGRTVDFSYDSGPDGLNAIGSIGGITPATSPVGSFLANGYGLYDMAGNVYEWCWDLYATPYGQPTTNNPTGPAGSLAGNHVLRSGSWSSYADFMRCAHRFPIFPSLANSNVGFRCVRGI